MCLILFAVRQRPDYPLVVIANRDEYYARPSRDAHWWDDADIYAGRDLEAGGTWLGVNRRGRFAAVTNVREPGSRAPAARTRGELTRNYLAGDQGAEEYLHQLATHDQDYAGFNLLLGDPGALWFYSNREHEVRPVGSGVYGISNGRFDEPWPKLKSGREELATQIETGVNHDQLMEILTDHRPADDTQLPSTGVALDIEHLLSSRFIRSPDCGTRACSVLSFGAHGRIEFSEHNFVDGERTGASRHEIIDVARPG